MTMQPDVSFGHETEGESGTFEARTASTAAHDTGGPLSRSPISMKPASLNPVSLGPVSIATRAKYEEAHRLACEIEELLTPADTKAMETEGYGPRLARALAPSLIDPLADLNRSRVA